VEVLQPEAVMMMNGRLYQLLTIHKGLGYLQPPLDLQLNQAFFSTAEFSCK